MKRLAECDEPIKLLYGYNLLITILRSAAAIETTTCSLVLPVFRPTIRFYQEASNVKTLPTTGMNRIRLGSKFPLSPDYPWR